MADLAPEATLHNYAKEPLRRKDVQAILKAASSVANVLNTRHKTSKEKGWRVKPPSKAAFVPAVLAEPNLLRRPILLHDGKIVVGRDLDAIEGLLA